MNQFQWISQITWGSGITALAIFLAFCLGAWAFSRYFPVLIAKMSKLSHGQMDDALITSFRRPIRFILVLTGIYLALAYLPLPGQWKHIVSLFYGSAATFSIGWGFFYFSDAIGVFFSHMGDRFDLQFNTIVIPFLAKLAKFIVVIMTVILILDQWNYHVTGLITGLGIGGLAIAMAAKDTLSNLFGGLVIITDAPFTIGDLIQSGTVEGVVEDINFRSTRIRTADQALVTVPNSTLANQPITNLSRMSKRRISLNIPLDLETPNRKLNRCVTRIRKLLTDDDAVYHEGLMVYLDEITSTSINLMVQFFVHATELDEFLKLKEKFNFAILSLLDEEAIDLATTRSQMVIDRRQDAVPKLTAAAENRDSREKTDE
ncbi:mechanosensitive ion channel family protein [Sporolactobacillus vineae]|uniref:mechanosensitive ion channel family protein n=1 Tax=Sporolactobacillus vineae TaxID=444463 RepID=UPI001EE6567C|nr:mechanosensitive ion channel family protein [Sporolactobacillus vineae]